MSPDKDTVKKIRHFRQANNNISKFQDYSWRDFKRFYLWLLYSTLFIQIETRERMWQMPFVIVFFSLFFSSSLDPSPGLGLGADTMSQRKTGPKPFSLFFVKHTIDNNSLSIKLLQAQTAEADLSFLQRKVLLSAFVAFVTLLLCPYSITYSSSSALKNKWNMLSHSLNSAGKKDIVCNTNHFTIDLLRPTAVTISTLPT